MLYAVPWPPQGIYSNKPLNSIADMKGLKMRTYNPATHAYGNLYSNLLDYVISAALIFYILTLAGIFRLRQTRPEVDRPYRALGYPIVPALYILGAATILLVLFVYRTATTWPGLIIVLLGLPVYFAWRPRP